MSQINEQASRDTAPAGSIRFNTDSAKMEIYNGEAWWEIDATSPEQETGGTRGLFCGGEAPSADNVIQFVNISTTGDATDFGDANNVLGEHSAFSSRTRGFIDTGFLGGQPTNYSNTIEFVTIASQGNAQDFGDAAVGIGQRASCASSTRGLMLSGLFASQQQNNIDSLTMTSSGNAVDFGDIISKSNGGTAVASPTRGIMGGGYESPANAFTNRIQYVTITTFGNSAEFGDLTRTTRYASTGANGVRAIFAGGGNPSAQDTIDFFTMATLGNASDFGNLDQTASDMHQGAASRTRAVFAGGSHPSPSYTRLDSIRYVQIASTGNSIDFGNLAAGRITTAGFSNGHGGLG